MKTIKTLVFLMALVTIFSCKKDSNPKQNFLIPNGDFESWTNNDLLQNWVTNSCPMCDPPFETYIVQKDSLNVYHGKYAAKLIYNGVFAAYAENKFYVPGHPSSLTGYVKSYIYGTDTVSVKIKLFSNTIAVDSGQWLSNATIAGYTKIVIPITQSTMQADSALITIRGGHKGSLGNNTIFWVDYLALK